MNPVEKPEGMYMVVPVEMLLLLPHPKFTELDPGKKSRPRLKFPLLLATIELYVAVQGA